MHDFNLSLLFAMYIDCILARNDGCEIENSIYIGQRSANIVAIVRSQFNIYIFYIATNADNFTRYTETFENKIHVLPLAAHIGFPIKIEFKLFGLKAPAGWRWYFYHVFTFIIDR